MAAPVKPSDFQLIIPSPTATICGNFIKSLLRLPVLVYQLVNWLLDSDGNLNVGVVSKEQPTGQYVFAGVELAEEGRLLCDGREVDRTTYATLFAAIGTTFGTPSSGTTFKLPDWRDRFPVGKSTTKANGATGGEAAHVLSVAELASHTHGVTVQGGGGAGADGVGHTNDTVTPYPNVIQTSATGGGAAHNNLPPYLACYIYIVT